MTTTFRHLALFVPELQNAESYYREIFDMEIIGREAQLDDGLWYALPSDKGWEQARAAGIDLGMTALRRKGFVLALFPGDPKPGQLYIVGLDMDRQAIAGVRQRLPVGSEIWEDQADNLTFRDRYTIVWQIYASGSEFVNSGEGQGRWLEI